MAIQLQAAPNEPWRPYTAFAQYAVPDYKIANGSILLGNLPLTFKSRLD